MVPAGVVAVSVTIGQVVRINWVRNTSIKLHVAVALEWWRVAERSGRQSQPSHRDTREARAESLERSAPRDGLGHSFCQFVEFVVHNFPFVCVVFIVELGAGLQYGWLRVVRTY